MPYLSTGHYGGVSRILVDKSGVTGWHLNGVPVKRCLKNQCRKFQNFKVSLIFVLIVYLIYLF